MKTMHDLKDDSRIWIYQANRQLSETEVQAALVNGKQFIAGWDSHGATMDAAVEVYHNRILIIAANEAQAQASGCGIDKSVRFVKELGETLGVDFFQRTQVLYRTENNELSEKPIHEFWAMRKAGLINENTRVLDNTIKTVGELNSKWEVPFSQSWHNEMWSR